MHTDRRDAVPRARLRRSGARTPVSVPTVDADAMRDLTRARDDPIGALKAATCRLHAFRLRLKSRDTGQAPWGPAPRRGRSAVVGATPAPPLVFQASVRAVHEPTARLPRLDHARHEPGHTGRLPPGVEARQALRGAPCPVAVTLVAERGDRTRGDHPRPLLRDGGLTPSADSSGARQRQGSLTQTGHPPARRARVDGAWASRDPAPVSRHLPRRRETRPTTGEEIHGKAPGRLCTRDRQLRARGPHAPHVVVAIARERIAWRWAMAQAVPVRPENAQLVLEPRS